MNGNAINTGATFWYIHFENAIHIVHARNLVAQLRNGVLHGWIGHHLCS